MEECSGIFLFLDGWTVAGNAVWAGVRGRKGQGEAGPTEGPGVAAQEQARAGYFGPAGGEDGGGAWGAGGCPASVSHRRSQHREGEVGPAPPGRGIKTAKIFKVALVAAKEGTAAAKQVFVPAPVYMDLDKRRRRGWRSTGRSRRLPRRTVQPQYIHIDKNKRFLLVYLAYAWYCCRCLSMYAVWYMYTTVYAEGWILFVHEWRKDHCFLLLSRQAYSEIYARSRL